jgi:predicted ester cyclase
MTAITAEENKAIVARFSEQFKNKGNHAIVDELFTPDFVYHLPIQGLAPGREGMKQVGGLVLAAFPDVHANVEELLADGDKVVERTSVSATSKGEFAGLPPTGKPVAWTELHIYRIRDGKVAELWSEMNLLGLTQQLAGAAGAADGLSAPTA